MNAKLWALGIGVSGIAACATTQSASPKKPVVQLSEHADAGTPQVVKTEVTTPPAEPIPVGKPGWKTVPQEQNGFWVALDGFCSQLAIDSVGKDVVVSYGGGTPNYFGGPQTAKTRFGHASFTALRDNGIESIDAPDITSPVGTAGASLDNFWIADSEGNRSSSGAILHWRKDGKWTKFESDMVNLQPWVDGSVMGVKGFIIADGKHDLWVSGTTIEPPAAFYDGYMEPLFTSFATGDVTIIVSDRQSGPGAHVPAYARHWSTAKKKITHTPLPMLGTAFEPVLFVKGVAPDEIYVATARKVAAYDGTSWKLLGTTSKDIQRVTRSAKGELWATLIDGSVEVSGPNGFAALKTPEKLISFDGMDKGQTWVVGESGRLYRRDGESWIAKPLPSPAFSIGPVPMKAKSVVVVAPDDVVVTAGYWEKGIGWTEPEPHSALFRSKKVVETIRCNEPDPENNYVHIGRGFQSWPPMATAECKTPFVVISRRSKQHAASPGTDWAKIKTALKGHADLTADGKLIEFISGDRTFVGAKARTVDGAKEIARLAGAKDRVRPEVLCAEPPPTIRDVNLE